MSEMVHKKNAPISVRCMIVTVSDTRTESSDKSGRLMIDSLEANGHEISDYRIVKDDANEIRAAVSFGANTDDIDCVLLNGGTGIAKRDVTIETIEALFEKKLTGYGELFRMLSYTKDIGSAAILSRAEAGIIRNTIVMATPGSTGAVKLAIDELILPELGHIVGELRKDL